MTELKTADDIELARRAEINKYSLCYESTDYGMSARRMLPALGLLTELDFRGSYLDIGCGRGEMVDHARRIGFDPVRGVEVTRSLLDNDRGIIYGVAHALPVMDQSFDVVSLFDVIEHLIPEDTEQVLSELRRVARKAVIITTNNQSSVFKGMQLHVNIKSYPEWDVTIRSAFPGADVRWLPRGINAINETWLILL